jgi:hypothetical protein
MRSKVNGVFVALTMMSSALIWSGCSKQPQPPVKDVSKAQSQYSGKGGGNIQSQYSSKVVSKPQPPPSDADIIKAIDDSGIMKRADGSFTAVPPTKVVEKGKQNKNGSWPVKVKFTLKYKMKDGKVSPPTETTSLFTISEEKDSAGKSLLKVRMGS